MISIKSQILALKRPNGGWCITGKDDYAMSQEEVDSGCVFVEGIRYDKDVKPLTQAEWEDGEEELKAMEYIGKRAKAYDPLTDQIDRVTKTLKYLKGKGIDIGPDGEKQVSSCEAVKSKFPKT